MDSPANEGHKGQSRLELPGWFCMRVFYQWRPGFYKVEHVMPPQKPREATLLHVPVGEIPLELIPPELRIPNSEIMVWIERGMVPTKVREKALD